MARRQRLNLGEVGAEVARTAQPTKRTTNRVDDRADYFNDRDAGLREKKIIQKVEPETCRMWERHNRLYDLLSAENCGDLIADIESAGGQKIPAIVRRLKKPEGGVQFEVIAGARRHFAVSYLRREKGRDDLFFVVQEDELSDEEAFRVSDLENRNREDISDYERALDYKGALDRYYGGNVAKMSKALGVAEKYLRNFEALASLPDDIVMVVPDPRELTKTNGRNLKPLLSDPRLQKRVADEICEIQKEQSHGEKLGSVSPLSTQEIVKRLLRAGEGKPSKSTTMELGSLDGRPVRVEVTPRAIALKVSRTKGFDADRFLEAFRGFLEDYS